MERRDISEARARDECLVLMMSGGGEESIMGCVQVGVKGGMKPHSFLVDIAKIVFCFFFLAKANISLIKPLSSGVDVHETRDRAVWLESA